MHTQRRVCHMPPRHVKKKREEKNIAHTKNIQGREKSHKGVPPSSTKNIHTFTYLDQGLWLVSPLDPVFDLAKYKKQVCLHILHTYSSTKKKLLGVGWKRKVHKKALVRNETHLSNPRDHPRNLQKFFSKTLQNIQIDGRTKEWGNGTLQAILTLNRQRW